MWRRVAEAPLAFLLIVASLIALTQCEADDDWHVLRADGVKLDPHTLEPIGMSPDARKRLDEYRLRRIGRMYEDAGF